MSVQFRTISIPEHLLRVREGSFGLQNYQTSSDSILARFVRVAGVIEQRWACQFDMAAMSRAQWQEWDSFIARLSGQAVLFSLRAPVRRLPLGEGAGFETTNDPLTVIGTTITGTSILQGATTALVAKSAPRYARSIHVAGLVPNALVLTHGDVFGLGGNLYMVVGKVTADANGEARVPFRWRLWKGARAGDIVTLRDPTCRVQLKSANEGMVTLDSAGHGTAGLAAVEVPYV